MHDRKWSALEIADLEMAVLYCESLADAAGLLRRKPDDVRTKALELGLLEPALSPHRRKSVERRTSRPQFVTEMAG